MKSYNTYDTQKSFEQNAFQTLIETRDKLKAVGYTHITFDSIPGKPLEIDEYLSDLLKRKTDKQNEGSTGGLSEQ